ncbi:MAG: hypothetical protein ACOX1P_22700 [Thermoguttaceae bacterium]
MREDNERRFPPWFEYPCPTRDRQRRLFGSDLHAVLVRLQISSDEVARWHAKGWLSFRDLEDSPIDEFRDPRVWELTIVRDIVRSGLADAQIECLLDNLPKPFAFDPDSLAFSFRHGWVEVVLRRFRDPDDVVEEHLDSWLDDCDEDRLRELKERIEELLEQSEEDAQEGKE